MDDCRTSRRSTEPYLEWERDILKVPAFMKNCPKCGETFGEAGDWNGVYIDCWPGYDLCKACNDYRCEHFIAPTEEDLKDPEFTSCHCGNQECRAGFVEGSTHRIITRKEFKTLVASWEKKI